MNKLKICLLLSYICIASISAAIITPALPQIEQGFNLASGQIEWLVAIFLVGYVLGQLIYGPLANSFGRIQALRAGLLINLLGIALCGVALWTDHYGLLLFARAVTALGAAAGLCCTFILIKELLNETQAKFAMSFTVVSFTLGAGIAVTTGGLLTEYLHWQYCFLALFLHGLVMYLLATQFEETLECKIPFSPKKIIYDYKQALKKPSLIFYSLTVGLNTSLVYCQSVAAPIYVHNFLGMSPANYAYWNLLNLLGMLGSSFLCAALLKYFDYKKILNIGLVLMFFCLLSLLQVAYHPGESSIQFFGTTAAMFLFAGMLFPASSHYALEGVDDKASSSSMMSFINMGSAMLSVILMAYIPSTGIKAFAFQMTGYFIFVVVLQLVLSNIYAKQVTNTIS